jgi:hypothetical protein
MADVVMAGLGPDLRPRTEMRALVGLGTPLARAALCYPMDQESNSKYTAITKINCYPIRQGRFISFPTFCRKCGPLHFE